MLEFPLISLAPTPDALRRLVGLRYVMVALLAAAALISHFVLSAPVPLAYVMAGVAVLLVVNVAVHRRVSSGVGLTEHHLFVTFVFEVLALTAVLYFMGGSTSPLVSLYLLPLTVAANVLTRRHTWTLALMTVLCYSLLLVSYVPSDPHEHPGGLTPFSQHVLGMWAIFIVSAALVAHYVSSLAHSLRERDRQLAQAREEALRNERIVALGTLSAGAAHELGTPLATISVLAEDMAHRHAGDAELASDVADLQGEVARCKRILNALTEAGGSTRGGGGGVQSADAFLAATVDRWQRARPASSATVRWADASSPKSLVADRTLEQALHNLLNNAADASPAGFQVTGCTDADNIVIDILDEGPGLTEEAEVRAGELFFSTKGSEGGMGLGLFLANATIERYGGSVRLFNRPTGGCCTRVSLPFMADAPAKAHR